MLLLLLISGIPASMGCGTMVRNGSNAKTLKPLRTRTVRSPLVVDKNALSGIFWTHLVVVVFVVVVG